MKTYEKSSTNLTGKLKNFGKTAGMILATMPVFYNCSGNEATAPAVDNNYQTQIQAPTITINPELYGTIDQSTNTTLTKASVDVKNGTLEGKVYVEQTNGNLLQVGEIQKDSNGKYLLDSTAPNTNTINTIFAQQIGTVFQNNGVGKDPAVGREVDLIVKMKGEDEKIYNVNIGTAKVCKSGTIYDNTFNGSCETPF